MGFKSLTMEDEFKQLMALAYKEVDEDSNQYKESRLIFSAGALMMFSHMQKIADLREDYAMKEMEQIQFQLNAFSEEIIKAAERKNR